jgi:hypothetical protein
MVAAVFCDHCTTMFELVAFEVHLREVVLPAKLAREARGGIFVMLDGTEYWAPTVQQLQAEGFKVVVRHNRVRKAPWYPPSLKGGATYVLLLSPHGTWAEGRARCSRKDSYSKKTGYVLAVNRALAELPGPIYDFEKEFFAEGWNDGVEDPTELAPAPAE